MTKNDNSNYNLKAIGAYIFGGSATIAHLSVGWNINKILEMTDDMLENNAYHFIKNYPNINVLKPSDWNNEHFLNNIKNENYDLLFANNPCSGLSAINRNANVNQPINNKFFEIFNIIDTIQPKAYIIENAPALVSIGTPLLQKMVNQLSNNYRFTIIRDMAGNHNVPMKRLRTLIIGWNKNTFNSLPTINNNIQNDCKIEDVFKNMPKDGSVVIDLNWNNLSKYYYLVKPGQSVLRMCCENYEVIKNDLTHRQDKEIKNAMTKLKLGKNIWDKSPWRLLLKSKCGSLTSVSRYLHPIEDRELTDREYARIMGYPDTFKFYAECKCSPIQCVAQGVPVNFIKYISSEIKRCFEYKSSILGCDGDICFQNNINGTVRYFKIEEFMKLNNLLKMI